MFFFSCNYKKNSLWLRRSNANSSLPIVKNNIYMDLIAPYYRNLLLCICTFLKFVRLKKTTVVFSMINTSFYKTTIIYNWQWWWFYKNLNLQPIDMCANVKTFMQIHTYRVLKHFIVEPMYILFLIVDAVEIACPNLNHYFFTDTWKPNHANLYILYTKYSIY